LISVTTSAAVFPSDPGAPFAHNGTAACGFTGTGCCAKPTAAIPSDITNPHTFTATIVTRIASPRFARNYTAPPRRSHLPTYH
jgi:hypothetical protein